MNQITKKYNVRILGCDYTILTDEPQEHVMHVASYVDSIMKEMISQKVGVADTQKAAVLAALKIASRLFELENFHSLQDSAHRKLIDLIDQKSSMV